MPHDPAEISQSLGGRFAIKHRLGPGAQGVVYAAHRRSAPDGSPADDQVALKIYTDPQHEERIRREIDSMSRIRDPALATLIEHGTVVLSGTTLMYCAWEFIKGTPLNERIATGPLTPEVAAVIGRDVARAIAQIWKERIVHRDINPKNIMLRTGDREAVLIDLGVARHLGHTSLTAAGFSWGTLGYLSPEQAQAVRSLTCKSDVFALGITLQEALLGRHPTNGLQAALNSGGPRTAVCAPRVPAGLARVIDSMLRERPVERPLPEQLSTEFTHFLNS